jgi:hypothetical protein
LISRFKDFISCHSP